MRRFRNILLVIEPGIDNHAAMERAFDLATSNEAQLSLISVIEEAPALKRSAPGLIESLVTERGDELRAIAAQWPGEASIHVPEGRPFLEVVRFVLQNEIDLVIKSEAVGRSRFRPLGSTDMHVLRKCPCPVWIVRSGHDGPCRRILAAVDVGPDDEEANALARRVLEIAVSLAAHEEGELDVLHAWSLPYENTLRSSRSGLPKAMVDQMVADEGRRREEELEALSNDVAAALQEGSEQALRAPRLHVPHGDPDDVIPDFVRESDIELVIMGTVGRTGVPGFFIGNTAEEVLSQIDCSVVAIKPPGFESPVTIA